VAPSIRKSWRSLRRQAAVTRSVYFARGLRPWRFFFYFSGVPSVSPNELRHSIVKHAAYVSLRLTTILVLFFIESGGLFLLQTVISVYIYYLVGPPEQHGCYHNKTIRHKCGHYVLNRVQSDQAANDLGSVESSSYNNVHSFVHSYAISKTDSV
jgi:hypothetical protein